MPDPGFKVPNGGMATHLVAKRCDLVSLGVPGPASTPGPRALRLLMGFRHGGEWDLNVGSGGPWGGLRRGHKKSKGSHTPDDPMGSADYVRCISWVKGQLAGNAGGLKACIGYISIYT